MSKYQYNEGCREISGFGGGYEDACRKMVIAGMEWWDEHPDAKVTYGQYENITGLTVNESDDCKALQNHMNEAIDKKATGAMMQAATNHVTAAHRLGWEKYLTEMHADHKEVD